MLQQIRSQIMIKPNIIVMIGIYSEETLKQHQQESIVVRMQETYNSPVRYPKMCIRAEGL